MRFAALLAFLIGGSLCYSQEASTSQAAGQEQSTVVEQTSDADEPANSDNSIAAEDESDRETMELAESVKLLSGGLKLTFILLMFTNAVICGRWAVETGRNFWAWYLFALFTGPLAGGCMLHGVATDKAGGQAPGGCLAALLGIGIPLAGWIVWLAILG